MVKTDQLIILPSAMRTTLVRRDKEAGWKDRERLAIAKSPCGVATLERIAPCCYHTRKATRGVM